MKMTGAKAVVEVLQEEGVAAVFHLPGSQIVEILDEIHQSPIRSVLTRHEQGAAFMADGFARATRGVGVCMSTVGPGAMNLVAGIAASYKASVPVIAITGVHDQKILERDSFHEIDQVGVFKPITKWSACIHRSDKVPEMLRKAFRVALSGRKGPVHLAIPSDVSQGELTFHPSAPARYRALTPPSCSDEAVEQVLDLIADAGFPVILAGNEILWARAGADLAVLAETLGIPAATTRDASGAFPRAHPLGVGLVGRGRGEAGNVALKQADLILALGVKFDYQTTRYNHEIIPEGAKIVHVSADPEEVGRIYPVTLGMVCDVGPVIRCLIEGARQRSLHKGLSETVRQIKREAQTKLDAELDYGALPLRPEVIARTLRRLLPPETAIVLDGGNFAKHVRRHFEVVGIDSYFYPDDFGSVGASFPMALGVKAAVGDRPVACLVGDGGFLLNSQELESAVRERLNVITVVFNDFGFGNVRAYQKEKFGGRYSCDYGNPPFDRMAQLFGAGGARVERLEELERAIPQALAGDNPFVVDVMMSPDALGKPGFLLGT
jgi:thiamine pyrophosphate-dependent acetolactate synthase large subunit-like protein